MFNIERRQGDRGGATKDCSPDSEAVERGNRRNVFCVYDRNVRKSPPAQRLPTLPFEWIPHNKYIDLDNRLVLKCAVKIALQHVPASLALDPSLGQPTVPSPLLRIVDLRLLVANSRKINTCRSLSKQTTLSPVESALTRNRGEGPRLALLRVCYPCPSLQEK